MSSKHKNHMSDVEDSSDESTDMDKEDVVGLLASKRGLSDSDDEHIDKSYRCEISNAPGANNTPGTWADLVAAPPQTAEYTCQQAAQTRPMTENSAQGNADRPNTEDRNRPITNAGRPNENANSSDRPNNEYNYGDRPLHVYLEGTSSDLAQFTKRRLRTVQNEINEYLRPHGAIAAPQWFFQGRFVRLTCSNMQQVRKLLAITKIGDVGVSCTLPRAVVNNRPTATAAKKSYIVFGISGDIPPEEVMQDNQCTGKKLQEKDGTYSIILTPIDGREMPYITVGGCLRRRTNIFYPKPLQCTQCWAYGHSKPNCGNRPVCLHCGIRGHLKEECHGLAAGKPPRCLNCKGQHMATDKGCPKFVENKQIKKIAVDTGLPFMQARNLWKDQDRTNNMRAGLQPTATNQTLNINQGNNHMGLMANNKRDAEFSQVAQRLLENTQVVNHFLLTLLFRVPNVFDSSEAVNIHTAIHHEISQNDKLLQNYAMRTAQKDTILSFASLHEYQDNCYEDQIYPQLDMDTEVLTSAQPDNIAPVTIETKSETSKVSTKKKTNQDKNKKKEHKPPAMEVAYTNPAVPNLNANAPTYGAPPAETVYPVQQQQQLQPQWLPQQQTQHFPGYAPYIPAATGNYNNSQTFPYTPTGYQLPQHQGPPYFPTWPPHPVFGSMYPYYQPPPNPNGATENNNG